MRVLDEVQEGGRVRYINVRLSPTWLVDQRS